MRTHYLSLKDIQVELSGGGLAIPTDHDWANQTHRTVNGLVDPKLTMRPGETQLWHVGNSSSALWYRIALVGRATSATRSRSCHRTRIR